MTSGCRAVAAGFVMFVQAGIPASAQIAISAGTHRQDFNSLPSSGTSNPWRDNVTLPGWHAARATNIPVSVTITNCRAGAGSSSVGGLYSFGTNETDRALGSVGTDTWGDTAFGVCFTNDSAQVVTAFTLSFAGEQWRCAGTTNIQILSCDFRCGLDPLDDPDPANLGRWTPVTVFSSPMTGTSAGAIDGNGATNRHVFTGLAATGFRVFPGELLFIRWRDANDPSASDHALAIDDVEVAFTLTASDSLPPAISVNPLNATNGTASEAVFEASASGTPPLFCQWWKNGGVLENGTGIAGADTFRLSLCDLQESSAGEYQLIVTNAFGMATSAVARLVVTSPPPVLIALWNFNQTNPASLAGSPPPAAGRGEARLVGGVGGTFSTGSGADGAETNLAWNTSGYPPQGMSNKTAGVQFQVDTTGFKSLCVIWQERHSGTASRHMRFQSSSNGVDFVDHAVVTSAQDSVFLWHTNDLAAVPGAADNPGFAFRLVSEFDSTAAGSTNGYVATAATSNYSPSGTMRFDLVSVQGRPVPERPCLGIQHHAGIVRLCWSSGGTNMTVERRCAVTGSQWEPAGLSPVMNGSNCLVDVPSCEGACYFRLRR